MVQSFCCCNLRIGGQAIGWISIFLCIYKLIDAIYKLITVDDPSAKDDPFRKKSIVEFSIGAVVVALVMNIFLLLGIKKVRSLSLSIQKTVELYSILIFNTLIFRFALDMSCHGWSYVFSRL